MMRFYRCYESDPRAASGLRFYQDPASDIIQPFTDAEKPESARQGWPRGNPRSIKPKAVVLHADSNLILLSSDADGHLARPGMLHDINQQFIHSLKEQDSHVVVEGFGLFVVLTGSNNPVLFLHLIDPVPDGGLKPEFVKDW